MNRSEYLLSAPGSNRPVLVLGHSLGTDFDLWNPLLGPLEEKFCVLRYNPHPRQDSHGVSGSITDVGTGLLRLLDRLGFARVNFCGVSMSGLLGQWLALEAPDRIRNLVLSNTAARIGNREAWQERMRIVRQEGLAKLASGLVSRWFSPVFAAQQPEVVEQFTNHLRFFSTEEYLAGCEAIRDADFRELAWQIKTRTLIIAGSYDRAATLTDAQFLNEQIRGSHLLVFPSGHLTCAESGEAFIQAVIEFLTQPGSHNGR